MKYIPHLADAFTGILYMIDAQYSILLRITVVGGGSSPGPDVVLEADVTSGPVRWSPVNAFLNYGHNVSNAISLKPHVAVPSWRMPRSSTS